MANQEREFVVRFAIGDARGLRSSVWRVWKGAEEGRHLYRAAPHGERFERQLACERVVLFLDYLAPACANDGGKSVR